ncbi:pickpocket protein 28-like [Rhynchophorus ferrugineus]|uniref:pickpocket protein 28-like n=1 Tax=Rhynchophorus ferrugineus TaxID=354439 RepID=UPI003FCEB261
MIPNEIIISKPRNINEWSLDPGQIRQQPNSEFRGKQNEYGGIYPHVYVRNISKKNTHISCTIQKKIAEKRKLRRNWQQQRTEENKRKFNRAIKELRDLIQIEQNQGIQEYLENLTSTEATDYSLWKATKKLRRSQQHNPPIKTSENNWARSNKEKADIFSKHLKNVFKPFQSQLHKDDENKITSFLDSPFQMDLPHEKLTVKKVKHTIMREINIKKAPGYDLITGLTLSCERSGTTIIKPRFLIIGRMLYGSMNHRLYCFLQIYGGFMYGKPQKKPTIRTTRFLHSSIIERTIGQPKNVNEKYSSRICKGIVQQLKKYCENSTLHGLRYVGDSHLTIGERIFWFISFSMAICFAAYYISNIYTKWKSSPVIISFSPFDAELNSIPFPAITICNMNQAKRNEAERILKEGSSIERKLLDDSCNGNTTFDNSENISWESLRDFLVKVGNSCSDMLHSCQWGAEKLDCNDIFNNDLTDEGLCCSFNRLPPEKIFRNSKDISILNQTYPNNVYDWDPEIGFTNTDNGDSIPKRPLGAGAHLGLSVILDANVENYYCSSTRSTGFKVILSNPIETPKMADFGFLISPGFETRISIEPAIREATSALRDIPIEKRQCYFSNERPLQYYRTYTQTNCFYECQSNYTFRNCFCVPYYLPKNMFINTCDKADDVCANSMKREMEDLKNGSFLDGECACKPGCYEVLFGFKLTGAPIWQEKINISSNRTSRSYTQQNCILECQSNYTLMNCKCVPYYLPKNKTIKYCGKSEKSCVDGAKGDMELESGNGSSCHCLPSCFFVKYKDSKSIAKLSSMVNNDIPNFSSNYILKNFAAVHFYFYNSKFTKEIKRELFTFTEILSNIGGLLSLCLGFSFLSLIELLYFLIIRISCDITKQHRTYRKQKIKKLSPPYPFLR